MDKLLTQKCNSNKFNSDCLFFTIAQTVKLCIINWQVHILIVSNELGPIIVFSNYTSDNEQLSGLLKSSGRLKKIFTKSTQNFATILQSSGQ